MSDYPLRAHTPNLTIETLPLALLTLRRILDERIGRVGHGTRSGPVAVYSERLARAITLLAVSWDERREHEEDWTAEAIRRQAAVDIGAIEQVVAQWPKGAHANSELGQAIADETMYALIGNEIHAPLHDAWVGREESNLTGQRDLRSHLIWEQGRPHLVAYLDALGLLTKGMRTDCEWPTLGADVGQQGLTPETDQRWEGTGTARLPRHEVPVLVVALLHEQWFAAAAAWDKENVTPAVATLALHALLAGGWKTTRPGESRRGDEAEIQLQKMGQWTEKLINAGGDPDHKFDYIWCGAEGKRPALTIYGPFDGASFPPNDEGTQDWNAYGWRETLEFSRGPYWRGQQSPVRSITASSMVLVLGPHIVGRTLTSFPRRPPKEGVSSKDHVQDLFQEAVGRTRAAAAVWSQTWSNRWAKIPPILSFPGQRTDGAMDVLVGHWIRSVQSLASTQGGLSEEELAGAFGVCLGEEWLGTLSENDQGAWLLRKPTLEHPWDTIATLAAASSWNSAHRRDPMLQTCQAILKCLISHTRESVSKQALGRMARAILPSYPLTARTQNGQIGKHLDSYPSAEPMDFLRIAAEALDTTEQDAAEAYLKRLISVRNDEAERIIATHQAAPRSGDLPTWEAEAQERLILTAMGGPAEIEKRKSPRIL